jgi:hypothetical protein
VALSERPFLTGNSLKLPFAAIAHEINVKSVGERRLCDVVSTGRRNTGFMCTEKTPEERSC